MPYNKYFIAIVIPSPLQEEIENIKRSLSEEHGLKGALRSPSHITLHRPFEWKEKKEDDLKEKLRHFKFSNTYTIQLRDFGFFEPRVIYIHVKQNESLITLHQQLKLHCRKELRLLNEVNDLRGFHPHVTVAFRDLKKPLFFELQSEFKNKQFMGTFDYGGFSLLRLSNKWEVIDHFQH